MLSDKGFEKKLDIYKAFSIAGIREFICTVDHEYKTFSITMHAYICTLISGNLILKEHLASDWVNVSKLMDKDWAPADIPIAEKIQSLQI